MIEDIIYPPEKDMSSFHLAGIIPLSGQEITDYNMDWHSSLMPVSPNYTMIEAAIYQCAMAGCETIWISVDEDVTPLIRHRIGEYVIDPVTTKNTDRPYSKQKWIPIHYVPTKPIDENRRDSVYYGVLNTARVASSVCNALSKWVTPDRYYVCSPFGLLDPMFDIRRHRKSISSYNKKIVFRYEGESVFDNMLTPFTISPEDINCCRQDVWYKSNGIRDMNSDKSEWERPTPDMPLLPTEKLTSSESYNGRWFGPADIFEKMNKDDIVYIDLRWYYDVSTFQGYVDFMSSVNYLKRPEDIKLNYNEWNPMSYEEN